MGSFFLFYTLLYDDPSENAIRLKREASEVIKQISSDNQLSIINESEIDPSKISELRNLSYDVLKARLRVEGDFCIFLEDEKGNIIVLNDTYVGIGSGIINVSNTPCNETL